MTIAAGILCSDGIIICADTEHTGDVNKFQESKIITIDDDTLLVGAGSTDYIRMTADKLRDELKLAQPVSRTDARQIVENVVRTVYAEHIFSFYETSDPYRPQMALIVAARCVGGELALIRTSETATTLGGNFVFAGSGTPIFEYWCRYFYRDRLTMQGMAVLALFMLKEVKKIHPGCGGSSHISYLPQMKTQQRSVRFFDENELLLGFPDNMTRLLSACFFEDTPAEWIEAKLKDLVDGVRALYRDEKARRDYSQPGSIQRDFSMVSATDTPSTSSS